MRLFADQDGRCHTLAVIIAEVVLAAVDT